MYLYNIICFDLKLFSAFKCNPALCACMRGLTFCKKLVLPTAQASFVFQMRVILRFVRRYCTSDPVTVLDPLFDPLFDPFVVFRTPD